MSANVPPDPFRRNMEATQDLNQPHSNTTVQNGTPLPAKLAGPPLSDREAIADACYRAFLSIDQSDEKLLKSSVTPDVYTYIAFKACHGYEELRDNVWTKVHSLIDTVHYLTNMRVSVDSETTSRATFNAMAVHCVLGKGYETDSPKFNSGAFYNCDAVKVDDVWKLKTMKSTHVWATGDHNGVMGDPVLATTSYTRRDLTAAADLAGENYAVGTIDDDITSNTAYPPVKRAKDDGASNTASASRSPGKPSPAEPSPSDTGGSSSSARSVHAAASAPAGIFDEHKSKYAGRSAVMAFPHVLSGVLGCDSPSKLHSLAYNFGTRSSAASDARHVPLGTLISEEDLKVYSDVHFSTLAPIFDCLDPEIFAQRCRDYYLGFGTDITAFGAVAAGVAALGSFLSPIGHPREAELVQYAKAILDDTASMRVLGIDHIIAWAMHVSYLRATSLPENVWIASCTMMHLCEAVGLHEEENIKKTAAVAGAALLGHDADRLRRIFWVSWAAHNFLAYEYDRSAVAFRAVTCNSVLLVSGSVADQFVQIAQIIPAPNSPFHLKCETSSLREELFERLRALDRLRLTHPFLVVTRADLAFCFYRRIYQLKQGISDDILQLVIDAGKAAIEAAQQLVNQGRLFWNVIGSAFQYICVLLAMDTPIASTHIAAAFQGLENLTMAVDTELTREALSMARRLLRLNADKKRKELSELEAVEDSLQPLEVQSDAEAAMVGNTAPHITWDMLAWEQFLAEPYRSMFGF
ncbi:c6 zinc finger domain containing protein [Grosmannia clavigera kw1407]|uniref:C6 zinc finger domain containing protein n=1 Tax=Grosmannia clavigera (strain kw1407 / UAMH 11150) TaxID=655863 RepID=F0XBR6_GROCL|nr:c6 zinc finger domain containing protein [Grosmannia clavigera kw1407]EFX04987.1 c6 zinc finger domain containing protein [Grosmannia clavigera kw1407]